MLLVDEIVSQTDDQIVCRKTIRPDEFFLQGHYPGFPVVPGVILVESAMQAGAILVAPLTAGAEGVPVVTRLNDVKFKRMIRPGDVILLEAQIKERLGNAFFLKAKISCEGKLAVSFEFACSLAPTLDQREA